MNFHFAYVLIATLLTLVLVGLLAPRVFIPYPVLLVVAGVGMTMIPGLEAPELDPTLILLFFLPPLLYKEAFEASLRDFMRWLRQISMLAVGLVAATVLAVAVVAKWLVPDLPWPVAFILGAVVSPTDTVAATAVIHRLRVDRRVTAVIGGESLVNDATGLVALQLAIGVVMSGTFSLASVSLQFAWTVAAGVGIGLVVGWAAAAVNRRIRDTTVLFTCSLIAPYLAFAASHAVQASGVLAVVAAGFLVSWNIHVVAADTRYQLYAVWRLLASLVDGLSFVLVGTTLPRILHADASMGLDEAALVGGCATLTVVLVRFLWVYQSSYLVPWLLPSLREREGGYPPKRNVTLIAWCGMRGAVSLAAAMSIPVLAGGAPFPGRDFVITCTVFVVLGTLIVQGMTLQPLIRLLGIRGDQRAVEEERLARISMIQAALSRLDELKLANRANPDALAHVEAEYLERLNLLIDSIARQYSAPAHRTGAAPLAAGLFQTELEAVCAERACLLDLRDSSRINDATQAALQEELDIAEMRLRTNLPAPP